MMELAEWSELLQIGMFMKQMDVLDGIRGYAIVAVMFYHFTQQLQHVERSALSAFDWGVARLFEGMWLGVDLFFVMSGFLITSILLGTVGKADYYKNFYVRRVLRIFPLYYAVILTLMFVAPLISEGMREQTSVLRENAFWFLTYTINWKIAYLGDFREISAGYMWSLAVEEQFYMFWPLLVAVFRKNLATICFSLVGVGVAVKVALHLHGVEGPSLYAATLTHMDGLLLGAGLAALYRNNGQVIPEVTTMIFKWLAVFSAIAMVFIVSLQGNMAFYEGLIPVLGVTAFSLIFAFMLIKALKQTSGGLGYTLLTLKPIMFCGKLCYGLYLLHHPIGVLLEKVLSPRFSFMSELNAVLVHSVISLALSLLVAYMSFHLFEKHFLGLKRHFETKDQQESSNIVVKNKSHA